ncbi:MAG: hypothetical protein CTY19_00850 [Methylomonas sp.]|nr:MAG: hypothetical protein CTY19_00850 [Methylomonas sp.]
MLHLISDSTLSESVIARIANDDDVILQAGAVWAAFHGHQDNPKINLLLTQTPYVYALQDVLVMSGINQQQLLLGVTAIDYAGFVELTVKNPVIHTWC